MHQQKMATAVLQAMFSKDKESDEESTGRNSARSSIKQLKMAAAENVKENLVLKEQLSTARAELAESKKRNETLEKKLDNLNNFVKRMGGSSDFMLKGSTSYFRKENQTLKTKVCYTARNLTDIKRLNEDLVRTHELDRRAIEELSATITDLEFRIRMGIVSDEYTEEYCKAAHEVIDHGDATTASACDDCNVLKLQLSKNSISLHCLIGRLKQMEERIFELKNENRSLSDQLVKLGDDSFMF